MTDRASGRFPDMLLGIEIRSSSREVHNFQVWVGLQDGLNLRTPMPGGPIPQEQDGQVRISPQDFIQEQSRGFSIHHRGAHRQFLTTAQVQGAIEVGLGSPWIPLDGRRLAARCPDDLQRGLKIQ